MKQLAGMSGLPAIRTVARFIIHSGVIIFEGSHSSFEDLTFSDPTFRKLLDAQSLSLAFRLTDSHAVNEDVTIMSYLLFDFLTQRRHPLRRGRAASFPGDQLRRGLREAGGDSREELGRWQSAAPHDVDGLTRAQKRPCISLDCLTDYPSSEPIFHSLINEWVDMIWRFLIGVELHHVYARPSCRRPRVAIHLYPILPILAARGFSGPPLVRSGDFDCRFFEATLSTAPVSSLCKSPGTHPENRSCRSGAKRWTGRLGGYMLSSDKR